VKSDDIFRSDDRLSNVNISYSLGNRSKKTVNNSSIDDRYTVLLGVFFDKKEAIKLRIKYEPYSYMLESKAGEYSIYYGSFKLQKSADRFFNKTNEAQMSMQISEIISTLNLPNNSSSKEFLLNLNP
jgi:hypothetical protein